MLTQTDLIKVIREAYEKRDFDALYPHLAEDVTYQILPSTFVVVLAYC